MSNFFITMDKVGELHVSHVYYLIKRIGVTPKVRKNSKIVSVFNKRFNSRKSANEYIQSEFQNKMIDVSKGWINITAQLDNDLCKKWLKLCRPCEWFIIRYFGEDKLKLLNSLAITNQESELSTQLDEIWFKLPDNVFNIIENPYGWNEFLSIVEK